MTAVALQVNGVRHLGYVFTQPNRKAYGRHELTDTTVGALQCGICDRWVIRGLGRWWERDKQAAGARPGQETA